MVGHFIGKIHPNFTYCHRRDCARRIPPVPEMVIDTAAMTSVAVESLFNYFTNIYGKAVNKMTLK